MIWAVTIGPAVGLAVGAVFGRIVTGQWRFWKYDPLEWQRDRETKW